MEKTGEKIVYSKNLPTYFVSDILPDENGTHCSFEQLLVLQGHIISIQDTNTLQSFHAQQCPQFTQKTCCLMLQTLFLFYIYTVNHGVVLLVILYGYFFACRARWPISLRQ